MLPIDLKDSVLQSLQIISIFIIVKLEQLCSEERKAVEEGAYIYKQKPLTVAQKWRKTSQYSEVHFIVQEMSIG